MFKRNPKTSSGTLVVPASGFRPRKAIVALDMDGDMLRVVQASGPGTSAKINRVGSAKLEIPPAKADDAAAVGAALRKALDQLKVKPKEAALSIPRGNVVLRPLQVPLPEDLRELPSVINFQIARDLPFRIEDAVVDFKVLRMVEVEAPATPDQPAEPGAPAVAQKRLDVLVGAAKAEVVQFYRAVAQHAGFKLAALGLRSIAAAQCVSRGGAAPADGALLLISVQPQEITIDVILDEKLVFSRVAAISFPEGDAKTIFQPLEIEVVRSLHSYEGSSGYKPVVRLLIAGGTGIENELATSLGARLSIPGAVFDPAASLKIGVSDSADAKKAVAPIGLALSLLQDSGPPIDFAHPKKPPVQRNTRQTQMLMAVAAALVVLLVVFGIRARLIKKHQKARDEVQAQLTDAEKKLPVYRRLKTQSKVVNGWLADDQNWLDHLAYLSSVLPGAEDIYVSGFTTSPQHLIRFSVQSRTGELLAELDKKLRAAGYEVKPLSITPASDKHGYNFRTTVELSIPKKMKPDFSKTKPPARPADDSPVKTTAAKCSGGRQRS